MKICYVEKKFRHDSLSLIYKVNEIVEEYQEKGYDLTLRQVYYQLVARDIIPNNEKSYKNVGNLISDGRMAGLIDWNAIIDRTRNLRQNPHWDSPSDIISACSRQFEIDKWQDQEYYLEVWIEKDALVGIVEHACRKLDIPYFSCRGYVSQSEMWAASQRLIMQGRNKAISILHLGDHDPSGKDMSRDIFDRLDTFGVDYVDFNRIALNYDQIEQYNPPPNPTKLTDSRATGYIKQYGYECWELDALKPEVLTDLIETWVNKYLDLDMFNKYKQEEKTARDLLGSISYNWKEIEKKYKL